MQKKLWEKFIYLFSMQNPFKNYGVIFKLQSNSIGTKTDFEITWIALHPLKFS